MKTKTYNKKENLLNLNKKESLMSKFDDWYHNSDKLKIFVGILIIIFILLWIGGYKP